MTASNNRSSRTPARPSRRAVLAMGITLAGAIGCGGNRLPPAPPGAPTPTPDRVLGIFPVPPPAAPSKTPVPTPIRFAHWLDGAARLVLDDLIARFNQRNPDVQVQGIALPFGEHATRLATGFAAADPPDVFLDSGPLVYDHLQSNALLALTSRIASDQLDLSRYWSDPPCRPIGESQYALPLWCAVDLLYYNRDAFGQARLSEPTIEWSWPDLLEAASKLTEGKPGVISRWGLMIINELAGGWGGLVASNGGRWLDESTGQVELGTASQEALQWVIDAINRHHVAPSPFAQQQLTRGGQVDPFLQGSVAMLVNGTWEMPHALADASFAWDVAQLPRAPRTGQSTSVASAQPGAIARAGKHPDTAWRWLRHLLDDDAQRAWAKGKTRLPSRKAVAADPVAGYATAPPAHAAAASDACANARDLQFRAGWQPARTALLHALNPAFNGQVSLGEALPAAVQAANRALAGAL